MIPYEFQLIKNLKLGNLFNIINTKCKNEDTYETGRLGNESKGCGPEDV